MLNQMRHHYLQVENYYIPKNPNEFAKYKK
jgi:hypothetical protein